MNDDRTGIFIIGLLAGILVAVVVLAPVWRGPREARLISAQECVRTAVNVRELQNCRRYFEEPQ